MADSRPSLLGTMGRMGGVNALAFGAGIARQKAFAVFLGPAGFGIYSLAASLYELLHTFARMGMHTGLLREMSAALGQGQPGRAARIYRMVRGTVVACAILIAGAVALAAPWVSSVLLGGVLPAWAVVAVAVGVPFVVASSLADAALNALDRITALAWAKGGTVVLSLATLLVMLFVWGLPGALAQIAVGAAIGLVLSTVLLRRHRPDAALEAASAPVDRGELLHAVLAIGVAQTLYHLAVTGNLFLFRSLVVAELGPSANGIYQGVIGLSRQYAAAIGSGVFVYLYPRLARGSDPSDISDELASSVSVVVTLAVPVALVLLATRDWIVAVVFTEAFRPMVPLMAWSLVGDVFVLPSRLLHMALLARGLSVAYAVSGLVVEGAYFLGFALLVGSHGLTGGLAAYAGMGVLGLCVYGVVLRRRGLWHPSLRTILGPGAGAALVVVAATLPLTPGPRAAMVAVAGVWTYLRRASLRSGLGR